MARFAGKSSGGGLPFSMFNPDFLGVLPSDPEYFKAECMKRSAEIMRDAPNILISQPKDAPFIIFQSVYWYYLYIRNSADVEFIMDTEEVITAFDHSGKTDTDYLLYAQKLYEQIQKFIIRQKWIVTTRFTTAIIRAPDDPDFEKNIQVAETIVEAIDVAKQEEEIHELASEVVNKKLSLSEAKEKIKKLFGVAEGNANELAQETN